LVVAGTLGVDVFFVLSGYLITSILLFEVDQTGTLDYAAFLVRRAKRLLPALGTLLLAYAIFAPLLFAALSSRRWLDIATAAFYVTNLRETFWPVDTPLSHTWSLAIEEQFYILWPFAVLRLARSRRGVAAWLLLSWIGLTLARTTWAVIIGGAAPYYFTAFHATGLLFGAMIAFSRPELRGGTAALAALLCLILGVTPLSELMLQPLAEVAVALVIVDPPPLLSLPAVCLLGRISYGVYLWHIPIQWAFGNELLATFGPAAGLVFLVAASCFAGWMSYILIERHFLPHQRREHLKLTDGLSACTAEAS
jgi:peptidoglycan/LPS O-acetylase OafA/YrhL